MNFPKPGEAILPVTDIDGNPLDGLTPTWRDPQPERPPIIEGLGGGRYRVVTGRVVGETLDAVLDFGPGAVPRAYRVRHVYAASDNQILQTSDIIGTD